MARIPPPLPLEEWEPTKETLHLYAQVVGKVRLAFAPPRNHWWHVTLYPNASGLTTGPMRDGDTTFQINFDFVEHQLVVLTDQGETQHLQLYDGLSVAAFYEGLMNLLDACGVAVR